MPENVIVLIGGGHAAGKRTAAESIKSELAALPEYSASGLEIEVLDMKQYMDPATETRRNYAKNAAITVGNKDEVVLKPSRFDFPALKAYLASRASPQLGAPQRLIIVHGLYALYDKEICEMSLFKVYVDSDADTRLVRWIRRDVPGADLSKTASEHTPEGGLEDIINAYLHGAKQEMTDYIFHTKERADVVMPRGCEANGIALIVDGLVSYLTSTPVTARRNSLRPFAREILDGDKGKFYELN